MSFKDYIKEEVSVAEMVDYGDFDLEITLKNTEEDYTLTHIVNSRNFKVLPKLIANLLSTDIEDKGQDGVYSDPDSVRAAIEKSTKVKWDFVD